MKQREIKFRAWIKPQKRMVGWGGEDGVLFYIRKMLQDKEVVLMQYTGLKDKNGKEIYEGDIIQLLGHRPNIDIDVDIEEVIFNNGEFCHTYQDRPTKKFWQHAEIIGNIYENKDLLN